MLIEFSSPAGVLYFKMRTWHVVHAGGVPFSSPAGVLYFKIPKENPVIIHQCFRPLLGFLISKFAVSGIAG